MTASLPPSDDELGEWLCDTKGWKQGSLFTLPESFFLHNGPTQAPDGRVRRRAIRSAEKLLLITQECDLIAKYSTEPYIEALICKIERPQFIARIKNSARWYLVDPQRNLVAHAAYRVQLDKKVLLECEPEPWPGTPAALRALPRWLAWRYDRPPLPEALVEAVQDPISDVFDSLAEQEPELLAAFNAVVQDVRFILPPAMEPPYETGLVFIVEPEELSAFQARALDAVWAAITSALDPGRVAMRHRNELTLHEISVADYLATYPLNLDYMTYGGDEIQGTEGVPRV